MLALPSLLPWLTHCRHHCHRRHCRCHCHGCCHLRRHQHRVCCYATAFWLTFVCPCAASASATVACHRHRHCRRWLVTVAVATNSCPLILPPQSHLCCHFLVDCCLPSHCLSCGHQCLPPPLPLLAADTIANRCPLPPAPCSSLPLSPSPLPLLLLPSLCRFCVTACCFRH